MGATVVLVATAAVVLAADASSKAVACRLPIAGIGHPSFGFRLVLNHRGGLPRLTEARASALLGLSTVLALVLVSVGDAATATAVGIGLAVGGAFGNLLDRRRRGAVVDFVVVGRWPPFNIADVALVGGVLVAAISAIT